MSETSLAGAPSLAARVILVRYVLFAIMSGGANLATQALIVAGLPFAPLMASVVTGTAIGFIAKYLLEKRWVFLDEYQSHASEIRKIVIYGFFGIGTTLLFWAVELGFWQVWHTSEAKYIGAAIGLTVGNWIKYMLDRHYVFPRQRT